MGGILFYVREDVSAKLLSIETLPTESFCVEINLRKKNGYFPVPITHIETISATIYKR